MGAVDVGFTEAVVGAGVTGILYVLVLFKTTRETKD
jgi:multicomponent Na+:H+ antiporter subunit B